jgi:hypothetical protein
MLVAHVWSAFSRGRELANAETWKNRTLIVNTLTAFMAAVVAIGDSMGYSIGVDRATLESLSVGIVAALAVFNGVMHVVTSKRIGLPSRDAEGGRQSAVDARDFGA